MHIYLICCPLQAARKGRRVKFVDMLPNKHQDQCGIKSTCITIQYIIVYEWIGKAEVGTDCVYAAHSGPSTNPYCKIFIYLL